MTTSILAVGIACAVACVVLGMWGLSAPAMRWRLRRIGVDPDTDITAQSENQRAAYSRYLERQRFLAVATAAAGFLAVALIAAVWATFSLLVIAACVGYVAWLLHQVRPRRHSTR